MSVSDKIYLAFEDGFVAQASTVKKDANGNNIFLSEYIPIEYIRKDTLLEWLNRMFDISAQSFEFQRNYAYGKVIDKLNSM